MSFMDSLGIDSVEADPNALPDGKYAGEVFKSELVWSKAKGTISHVITYRVTEGERAGAQRQEWFTLGTDPVYDDEGNLVSLTPTMTEQAKPWYKKRFVDLGVPEAEVSKTKPEALVGLPVNFGVKKNGAYININFVELRHTAEVDPSQESSSGNIAGML